MNELPDYLPGNPPMYGVKQEATQRYQGNEIVLDTDLVLNNTKVTPADYELSLFLKDTYDNEYIIWLGHLNHGIYIVGDSVQIRVPRSIAVKLSTGTYYVTIVGSKPDASTEVLANLTFSLALSAASNNPIPRSNPPVAGISTQGTIYGISSTNN